jgi:hypothetical protein
MQTLAGLALDTEHQQLGKVTPDAPLRAIQYLLNTFALLNVFHFLALLALGRLDRRRKAAAALIINTRGSPGVILSSPYHQNQSGSLKGAYTEDAERTEDDIRSPLSAGAGLFSSATSPDHTPLLSDARRSYFTEDVIDSNRRSRENPPKTKLLRRGELFAGLSAALVVFAWALFLVTAWLKLRSKAERGGSTSRAFGLRLSD